MTSWLSTSWFCCLVFDTSIEKLRSLYCIMVSVGPSVQSGSVSINNAVVVSPLDEDKFNSFAAKNAALLSRKVKEITPANVGGFGDLMKYGNPTAETSSAVCMLVVDKSFDERAGLFNNVDHSCGGNLSEMIEKKGLSLVGPSSTIVRGDEVTGAGDASWLGSSTVFNWSNKKWVVIHGVLECASCFLRKTHTFSLRQMKMTHSNFLFACIGFVYVGLLRMAGLKGAPRPESVNVLDDGRTLVNGDIFKFLPSLRVVFAQRDGKSSMEVRKAWKDSPYSSLLGHMATIIRFFKAFGWFCYTGLSYASCDVAAMLTNYVMLLCGRYRHMKGLTATSVIAQIMEFVDRRPDLKSDPLVLECLALFTTLTSKEYASDVPEPNFNVQLTKYALLFAFALGVDLVAHYSLTPSDYRQSRSRETGPLFVKVDCSAPLISPKQLMKTLTSMGHAEKVIFPVRSIHFRNYVNKTMDSIYSRKWVSVLYRSARYWVNHHRIQLARKKSGRSLDELWKSVNYKYRQKNWNGIRKITDGKNANPVNLVLRVALTDYYRNSGMIPKYCPGKSVLHTNAYWILRDDLDLAHKVVTKICRDNCVPGDYMPVFECEEISEMPKMLLHLPVRPAGEGSLGDEEAGKYLYRSPRKLKTKPKYLIIDKGPKMTCRQAMAIFGYRNATNADLVALVKWLEANDPWSATSFWVFYSQIAARSGNSPFGELVYPTKFYMKTADDREKSHKFIRDAESKAIELQRVYDPSTVDMDSYSKSNRDGSVS